MCCLDKDKVLGKVGIEILAIVTAQKPCSIQSLVILFDLEDLINHNIYFIKHDINLYH